MRILLIGNFAPPYEEESLHNISFLNKLESEGNECTVINTSEQEGAEKRFINTKSYIGFCFILLKVCWRKDVVHFFTKGYLRLGLLKLMTSIMVGTIYRSRTFITIHSELFSIAGQMRSPVGGRQTLFTAFTLAGKIICADKDTYDVAAMYMKKSNFELIPSFLHFPAGISKSAAGIPEKLDSIQKVIVFANVMFPSFAFDILNKFLTDYPLPSDTAIVVAVTDKPVTKMKHLLEEEGQEKHISDNLILVDADDLDALMAAYSRADIVLRPLSCDGTTFFESFAVSVKKTMRKDGYMYFPNGLLFVKEGDTSEMCACIINTLLCVETGKLPDIKSKDSYSRILSLYQGTD